MGFVGQTVDTVSGTDQKVPISTQWTLAACTKDTMLWDTQVLFGRPYMCDTYTH